MDEFKPTIPDNIRLVVYLVSGIGTPFITLVFTLLLATGALDAQIATTVIAASAAFFGSVAGLFGISNFSRSVNNSTDTKA